MEKAEAGRFLGLTGLATVGELGRSKPRRDAVSKTKVGDSRERYLKHPPPFSDLPQVCMVTYPFT